MFTQNLGAFTTALGIENAPTVIYLSLVPWPTEDDRDEFISILTRNEKNV